MGGFERLLRADFREGAAEEVAVLPGDGSTAWAAGGGGMTEVFRLDESSPLP